MSLAVAIAELLVVTEAGAESCARGDTSTETMIDLASRRGAAIAEVERFRVDQPLTPEQRVALQRANALGDELLAWCARAQTELEKTRNRIRTTNTSPTTPSTARFLSDIA